VGTKVRAAAVAACFLCVAPVGTVQAGASPGLSELQAAQARMEVQMQQMAARLDELAAVNAGLRARVDQLNGAIEARDAEIDALQAEAGELRKQGVQAADEIGKVKGAEWASRLRFKGDLRVRDENIATERVVGSGPDAQIEDAADRNRMRFRARLVAEAQVTMNSKVVFGIASGEGDPRSTNQTFGNIGSGKPAVIDLAYADWAFAPGARVIVGKQKQPYWRPGMSFFFDNDLNPEGGAVTYERGAFFGSAYGWWLQESYSANPAGNNADANILGAQAGFRFGLLGGETRVAAHYYDCGACQHNNPFWSGGNAYGNTTIPQGAGSSLVQVLKYDYDVLELAAEMNTTLFGLPFQVWADFARNLAPGVEYDTAYGLGVFVGKASSPRSWEAGLMYQSMDKDAMFAQLIDSDFAAGVTDGEGWGLQLGYAPVKNVVLQAQYFINDLNKDVAPVNGPGYEVGKGLDYDRWRLDVNYRF